MALRYTVSASKRPELVRKPQQVLAARFKLCGRKPLRGLPPSPRWTWRCALREANVRKGLGGYTRSSGTYLGPSGCANAPRGFVLSISYLVAPPNGLLHGLRLHSSTTFFDYFILNSPRRAATAVASHHGDFLITTSRLTAALMTTTPTRALLSDLPPLWPLAFGQKT